MHTHHTIPRTYTTTHHTPHTTHHTPHRCIDILATSMLMKWTERQPRYSGHNSCSPFHAHTLSDCFTFYSFLAVHFVSVPPFRNFSLPIPIFLFSHSNGSIIPFNIFLLTQLNTCIHPFCAYSLQSDSVFHSFSLCPFSFPFTRSTASSGSGLPEAGQLPAWSHRGA